MQAGYPVPRQCSCPLISSRGLATRTCNAPLDLNERRPPRATIASENQALPTSRTVQKGHNIRTRLSTPIDPKKVKYRSYLQLYPACKQTAGKLFEFVSHQVREETERRELEALSPHAAKAAESAGRTSPEEQDPVRTCYQRDRDRVLHSKSFRRLKHKTQVFIDPAGDHYRTRLTHTLEVAQIARTIGRALRLNEDLIEAVALAHDLGHPPFGHTGEEALDLAIKDFGATTSDLESRGPKGFRHDLQSLRIVDVLEDLNLTQETRLGIAGHSKGRKDLTAFDGQPTSTLDAAVVRISDRIAYLSHDIDDALRAEIIQELPPFASPLGSKPSERIGTMVLDVISNSLDQPSIKLSPTLMDLMNKTKEWMFENVYYHYPRLYPDTLKAQALVRELFFHFAKADHLPQGFDGLQGTIDYIAGMTDRFAIETFENLRVPQAFR